MQGRDTVVIGASAGGVEALVKLVGQLPADLPAYLLVVLHVAPDRTSVLPRILSNAGPLPAAHAKHGERPVPGHIYIAPPIATCSSTTARCASPRGRARAGTGRRSTVSFARLRAPAAAGWWGSCFRAPSTTAPPG